MATKQIAWNTGSGNITLTYNGQGDGPISAVSDPNDIGSARSKTITIETTRGGLITKNVTISQAACPFPVGDVKSYSYTGDVQSVLLPAGQYKLQCWGAQGGSVSGSYTAAGSKGGYSEGVLTLSSPTTVYIFVGGKGTDISTSNTTPGIVNGGWNGGGGSVRVSSNSDEQTDPYSTWLKYTYGISYPRGGGGATDIALVTSSMSYSGGVTDRSLASLLSRMIVAGGGGGASADYYERYYNETQITETIEGSSFYADSLSVDYTDKKWHNWGGLYAGHLIDVTSHRGETCTFTGTAIITFVKSGAVAEQPVDFATGWGAHGYEGYSNSSVTVPDDAVYLWVQCNGNDQAGSRKPTKIVFTGVVTVTQTGSYESSEPAYGGGANGGNSSGGTQSAAASGASFGKGATQSISNYKFVAGGGGGGWYGGGSGGAWYYPEGYLDINGGGSGFVNTAASAGNRPSGYTGLQLDSGETKAGNTSFPNTSGSGTETGHSGNGYAKITRLS